MVTVMNRLTALFKQPGRSDKRTNL
jgi:hypothetical protein